MDLNQRQVHQSHASFINQRAVNMHNVTLNNLLHVYLQSYFESVSELLSAKCMNHSYSDRHILCTSFQTSFPQRQPWNQESPNLDMSLCSLFNKDTTSAKQSKQGININSALNITVPLLLLLIIIVIIFKKYLLWAKLCVFRWPATILTPPVEVNTTILGSGL